MTILSYRNFFIVTRSNGAVDLINPHNERVRVVKSVFAAKWRVGRVLTLANKALSNGEPIPRVCHFIADYVNDQIMRGKTIDKFTIMGALVAYYGGTVYPEELPQ
jgi:hypothetical protein